MIKVLFATIALFALACNVKGPTPVASPDTTPPSVVVSGPDGAVVAPGSTPSVPDAGVVDAAPSVDSASTSVPSSTPTSTPVDAGKTDLCPPDLSI